MRDENGFVWKMNRMGTSTEPWGDSARKVSRARWLTVDEYTGFYQLDRS